jgi:uncharacterized protein YndB with AHSA1/START domain
MDPRQHPFHLKFRQRTLFAADITARSEILAPVADVWDALVDFDGYGDWNPFTPKVETEFKVGARVTLHVDMPGRSKSVRTEWINLVEPGQTICWGMQMGHASLLCANRWQMVRAIDDTHTEYVTTDYFSGLLTPLVMALYGEPTRLGFQSVADGLKQHMEKPISGTVY